MSRYVLTGTTGRLGSRTLRSILEKKLISPADLVISSSNPAHVPPIAQQHGVEIRSGNYTDPESLRSAFAGADVLFLMSHPDPGVQRVEFHRNAIETARDVGISTVVYSSMMFGGETGLTSVIGIQQGHIRTARYLAQSGMDHVIVRQGIYAQAWGYYAGFQSGVFRRADTQPLEWVIPHDAAIAWAALDELGEGNAAILADYRSHLGQTLRLTGPRATTISEIARLVESRTGRAVNLRLVGKQEAVRYHKERQSVPPWSFPYLEENWSAMYDGLQDGEGEVVDPLLGHLLGRPATGIEEMADELFVLQ
ncbi:NAD(P)H-binding protein [Pseudonocardia xinjiangensis]|uniref:NAD(P)H-binding protein n=1 Tax=Pseudonocardia xinjiangensis TaxID=75289 RepID=A0ABX1REN7_9PSEU|nr:NAD(P)H-binding protein [Pseudonocardia xinjiangensis]NMH78852.1 NAD(P)H-binding protein [Pseudonocardia xinjiangensis]